jgi:hypothetical protein
VCKKTNCVQGDQEPVGKNAKQRQIWGAVLVCCCMQDRLREREGALLATIWQSSTQDVLRAQIAKRIDKSWTLVFSVIKEDFLLFLNSQPNIGRLQSIHSLQR